MIEVFKGLFVSSDLTRFARRSGPKWEVGPCIWAGFTDHPTTAELEQAGLLRQHRVTHFENSTAELCFCLDPLPMPRNKGDAVAYLAEATGTPKCGFTASLVYRQAAHFAALKEAHRRRQARATRAGLTAHQLESVVRMDMAGCKAFRLENGGWHSDVRHDTLSRKELEAITAAGYLEHKHDGFHRTQKQLPEGG